MEVRKCSVCGIQESFVGNKVGITTINGIDYCSNHIPKIQSVAVKDLSTDQKQTALVETSVVMQRLSERQTKALESIKGMMTFIVVIIIVGIFVQLLVSCVP